MRSGTISSGEEKMSVHPRKVKTIGAGGHAKTSTPSRTKIPKQKGSPSGTPRRSPISKTPTGGIASTLHPRTSPKGSTNVPKGKMKLGVKRDVKRTT